MATSNADTCHTIRLPAGMADQIRIASGQPLSKLLRYMCRQYLQLETNKRAQAAGRMALTPSEQLEADIADIKLPGEEA